MTCPGAFSNCQVVGRTQSEDSVAEMYDVCVCVCGFFSAGFFN